MFCEALTAFQFTKLIKSDRKLGLKANQLFSQIGLSLCDEKNMSCFEQMTNIMLNSDPASNFVSIPESRCSLLKKKVLFSLLLLKMINFISTTEDTYYMHPMWILQFKC